MHGEYSPYLLFLLFIAHLKKVKEIILFRLLQLFIWIGVFLDMYARTEDTLATGIILYGSYISESVKLSDYPVPVLTISGDQDGLCRLTRIAKDFG